MRRLVALVAIGAVWLGAACGARAAARGMPAAAVGSIREMPLGAFTDAYPFGIASGPDGDIWFAQLGCIGSGRCWIGRLSTGGALEHLAVPRGSVPFALAAGPDGDVWFTDAGRRPAIGRITPRGSLTEFHLRHGSVPFEIALGRDGDMWFTDQGSRPAIGRITPGGAITEFGLRRGSIPFGIAVGSSRVGMWFTDRGCSVSGACAIGRITNSGRVSESAAGLRAGAQPLGIAAGFGGGAWFADSSGAIGRASPNGHVSESRRGLPAGSSPVAVAPGPDGAIWFSDEGARPAIGRVSPTGRVQEFSAGLLPGSEPAYLAPMSDGRVWFSDEGSTTALGAIQTTAPPAERIGPSLSPLRPVTGSPVHCRPGHWVTWDGLHASTSAFASDGYSWLRRGAPIPGARDGSFTPTGAGARLACAETVTYPPPLTVTARVASASAAVAPAAG
ncbi:MAG: virginiamycin B lyase family protein [Solirubrobacteraceae bacterium]